MSLDYSGYFDNYGDVYTTLGSETLAAGTPFSMTATFDEKKPSFSDDGWGAYQTSALSFLIGGTTYTASSPTAMFVQLYDATGESGYYTVGLSNSWTMRYMMSSYDFASPGFVIMDGGPVATEFSGWNSHGRNGTLEIALVGVIGGLQIGGLGIGTGGEGPTGPTASLSMSAVPEVTSSFTLLGLITSGLLLRRRGRLAQ